MGEGHFEGVFDQFGAHVIGQGPADDPTTGQVDDRRQVGPALPGGDVDIIRQSMSSGGLSEIV
jgi:hypothetical protein